MVWEVTSADFEQVDGTAFWIPPPPMQAVPVWRPRPASLRLHVQQRRWCWRLFELLRMAAHSAYQGKPQRLQMAGVRSEGLGHLTEWLCACGAVVSARGVDGSAVFHLEFVVQ